MRLRAAAALGSLFLAAAVVAPSALATTAFSNTPLIATWSPPAGLTTSPNAKSTGDSEPAIAVGPSNTLAVDGLAWLPFQVNLWKGQLGTTPSYFGAMATSIPQPGNGRIGLGDGDADLEITSAGTTLLADLNFVVNKNFNSFSLGVDVTRCPSSAAAPSDCTVTRIDSSGADRPWITHDGTTAYLSYHDSGNSSLIHVVRSTNDGQSWTKVGDPIVGQGSTTGSSTFNNDQGPLVADPSTHDLFDVYAAGQASVQKGTSGSFNNIYVSRSTDGGRTWTASLVFHAPLFTALNNIFPALAVDPTDGHLYAAWSDQHHVWVSTSTDSGQTWSAATSVSTATTVVMPWVAALNGKVDVVYYGTSAASIDDTSADWFTYDSQFTGAWAVKQVSNTSNRHGAVCLGGAGCTTNRELLDLFEVVENPATGKAVVIYTDTTIDTWTQNSTTSELPEIVLAYEQ